VVIVWLEDPTQWKYLRESFIIRGSRRGFKHGVKLPIGDFYKLVGYELLGNEGPWSFLYRILWLKTYDSGCPKGHEVYDKHGGRPCEAKSVSDLLKEKAKDLRGGKRK